MSREMSAGSRIPRPGVSSRIPQPGAGRFKQPLEPKIQYDSNPAKLSRPTSFGSLRPQVTAMMSLKKSLSGDKIGEAGNLMSKRKASVIKKFLTKPEKSATNIETGFSNKTDTIILQKGIKESSNEKLITKSMPETPKPLMRSDTFISDGDTLTQSTPLIQGADKRQAAIYTTQSLDDTIVLDESNIFQRTHTIHATNGRNHEGFGNTFNKFDKSDEIKFETQILEDLKFGKTRILGESKDEDAFGCTMNVSRPMKYDKQSKLFNLSKSKLNNAFGNTIKSETDLINVCDTKQKLGNSMNPNDFNQRSSLENLGDITIPNLDSETTLTESMLNNSYKKLMNLTGCIEDTLMLAPDKSNMNLVLNSTMHNERLLDLTTTISPAKAFMNLSHDLLCSPRNNPRNTTNLLYMTQHECDRNSSILEPFKTRSQISLPTKTPDEPMDIDDLMYDDLPLNVTQALNSNALQELKQHKPRFSFGLDLTECTLDCSIELCDVSLGSNAHASTASPSQLKKQNSFEMDESLGILTPDQMKEFLDSATTTTNLDLPLGMHPGKLSFHQMRVDQTPSPEDLPLDPVGVKTDINEIMLVSNQNTAKQVNSTVSMELSQTDTESKTDQMSKSTVSKISTSFITSVTSVTSLDTGYQGDGEMSRPASRGAGDHSPSNGPTRKSAQVSRQPSFNQNIPANIPIRRQDPMTDSDFFTESDADDIFHRGDRRAQVIDGQLYGPMLQATASVFITEQPEQEDSCMESSGIFTDIENRCDDDIAQLRQSSPQDIDMSPDGSTDTVKSNNQNHYHSPNDIQHSFNSNNNNNNNNESEFHRSTSPALSQGHGNMLTDSQTSSTINSSFSSDRISIGTADYKRTYSETKSSSEALSNETTTKAFPAVEYTGVENTTLNKAKSSGKHVSLSSSTSLSSVHDVQNDYDCYKSKQSTANSLLTSNGSVRTNVKIGISNNRSNTSRKSVLSKKIDARNTNSNNCSIVDRNDMLVKSSEIQKCTVTDGISFNSHNRENQENKSPQLLLDISSPSSRLVNTTITIGSPLLRKNTTTNKWDAVMNKIAVNKASVKKNYNAVKSKVSTGVLRRTTTPNSVSLSNGKCSGSQDGHNTNIASGCSSGSPSGLQSPQTKRIVQSATKRGRSFSKDSQQSSQSDISHTSASPKLLAKTPQRAAKKRDVRNLTISPTDLGPPPKAQQTTFGSNRTKQPNTALSLSKRPTLPIQQNVSTPIANIKNSPSAKKTTPRRIEQKTHVKTPLKDHNRLVNQQQQQQQQQQQNGTAKTNGGISNKTNGSIVGVGGGGGGGGGVGPIPPVSSTPNADATFCGLVNSEKGLLRGTPPSPILSNYNNNCINGPPASLLHKKHQIHQQQQQQKQRPIANNGTRLEFESEESSTPLTQALEQIAKPPSRDVEALGVLLNYLVYDLDAFNGPFMKKECEKSQNNLTKTLSLLDEAKASCHELQDQLQDKEAFYSTREQELHALHRCELKKAETKLYELESNAKERITSLKAELEQKDEENDKRFNSYRMETDVKFAQKVSELEAAKQREEKLLERLNALEQTENTLREKIQATENNFSERLQSAAQRERELVEKVNTLSKQLNDVTKITENRERELEEKLNLSQDEVSVLRLSRSFSEQSQSSGNSPRNSSDRACELQRLHSEIESLRCVLEIKQKEISKLTKQNQELTRDAEESIAMQGKISTLESSCEMLQTELQLKSNKEKELREKYDDLKKNLIHETTIRTRLSFDNEALQWQLKQRSEQLHIVEGKLHETVMANVSKSSFYSHDMNSDLSHNSSLTSLNRTNGVDRIQFHMDDVSPPTSPIVKGVIEKTDSVSWVLEMDDETPEVAASKMVRRAGSFRSSINEKSPGARRQLSLSSSNGTSNPLTQSASATSVIRQHSSDANNSLNHSRTRSKSVSKSSEPKKVVRQNSGGSRKIDILSSWKEPVCCSSPYTRSNSRLRQLTKSSSPVENVSSKQLAKSFCGETENGLSKRKQSRHLITCDISSLNSGEKLEMRSLPSHASVHDLKSLKKCQEIMESAGEAMVSGTNSEDEGCSASSDDVVSSSSGSSSSLGHKTHNMSIEEVLLLDKINTSLNGTPMEVSWSDDPDQFANESIV